MARKKVVTQSGISTLSLPAGWMYLIVPSLLTFPTDRNAYACISALLTLGNLHAEKSKCELYKSDVYGHAEGSKFIVLPPTTLNAAYDFEPSFKTDREEYFKSMPGNI